MLAIWFRWARSHCLKEFLSVFFDQVGNLIEGEAFIVSFCQAIEARSVFLYGARKRSNVIHHAKPFLYRIGQDSYLPSDHAAIPFQAQSLSGNITCHPEAAHIIPRPQFSLRLPILSTAQLINPLLGIGIQFAHFVTSPFSGESNSFLLLK
jgi:hypothetical protein